MIITPELIAFLSQLLKRNFARNGYESAAVHQVASVIVDIHHEQVCSYSSGFV